MMAYITCFHLTMNVQHPVPKLLYTVVDTANALPCAISDTRIINQLKRLFTASFKNRLLPVFLSLLSSSSLKHLAECLQRDATELPLV